MKKYISLIYICTTVSILNIIAILFFSQASEGNAAITAAPTLSSLQQALTIDVFMPETADFAGEKVPLHRADVEEAFRKELIVNTYLHSHTLQILKNAPRMFARIEPILKENGIPEDFKYLAVIESNLNPSAASPAGAVGLWQFLSATGKEAGLEINSEVDERYNVEKATEAAANYLKKAYERFGSWTLAAASYNAGAAMIQKQIDIQKEKNYYDLLLGEETERYVFRILALKQILNHPNLYNFEMPVVYPVDKVKLVKVKGPVEDWADFAHKHHITYKTLKRFNPWLRKNKLKNPAHREYKIRIPTDKEKYK